MSTIRTLAAGAALAVLALGPATAAGLEPLKGKARPVVIFAGNPDDPAVAKQVDLLKGASAELESREMPVLLVGRDGVTSAFGAPAPKGLDPRTLRLSYYVREEDFAVILVGKDGGTKFRSKVPVAADRLTGLVDKMPMRQEEAR